jgi:hypothetical protein
MIAYTLEQAESDLRNVYWMIRASRATNWKHVNRARSIKDALRRMGIKKHEISDACYCLKNFDCKRCNKNNGGIPCWSIAERRRIEAKAEAMQPDI